MRYLIILSFFLFACSEGEEERVESLKDKLMNNVWSWSEDGYATYYYRFLFESDGTSKCKNYSCVDYEDFLFFAEDYYNENKDWFDVRGGYCYGFFQFWGQYNEIHENLYGSDLIQYEILEDDLNNFKIRYWGMGVDYYYTLNQNGTVNMEAYYFNYDIDSDGKYIFNGFKGLEYGNILNSGGGAPFILTLIDSNDLNTLIDKYPDCDG